MVVKWLERPPPLREVVGSIPSAAGDTLVILMGREVYPDMSLGTVGYLQSQEGGRSLSQSTSFPPSSSLDAEPCTHKFCRKERFSTPKLLLWYIGEFALCYADHRLSKLSRLRCQHTPFQHVHLPKIHLIRKDFNKTILNIQSLQLTSPNNPIICGIYAA